jgi:transposase
MSATDSLPDDVETLQRLLRIRDAELGRVRAQALSAEALIAHLRLAIEKMRRELYGQRAERKARLLDQMELELEELEAAAAEDEFAAGKAAATSDNTTAVRGFTRRKPSRKPFPAHLPRERVIVQGPTACACCSSTRLALEVVPRQWKVVQYVREKFTCRACERISQAPAPFHVLPRGFAGPSCQTALNRDPGSACKRYPFWRGGTTALAPGGAGQGCAAGASAVAWEGALSVRRGF